MATPTVTPSAQAIISSFPEMDGASLWLKTPCKRISTIRHAEPYSFGEMPYRVYWDLKIASFKVNNDEYKPLLLLYKKGTIKRLEEKIAETKVGFNKGYNFVEEIN